LSCTLGRFIPGKGFQGRILDVFTKTGDDFRILVKAMFLLLNLK